MSTIFISYSHKDEKWKDRLVIYLKALPQKYALELWDDRKVHGGDQWKQKIKQALNRTNIAILLISADFLASDFIMNEEVPILFQRKINDGIRFIPVILKSCPWKTHYWLEELLARPKNGKPLATMLDMDVDEHLTILAEEIHGLLQSSSTATSSQNFIPLSPDKIYLAKLPTSSPDFFGREKELAELDQAWNNPKLNIVVLTAWGGVGKTTLVNQWLNRIQQDNYRGAMRVYGWSFYSQGTKEDRQASADEFLAHALEWFGDPDPKKGTTWDKGVRLANLIRQQKTLLILDGLEPLQYPLGMMGGQLKDPGIHSLLKELACVNPGLCIITTRESVQELKSKQKFSAKHIPLDNLSLDAGIELLKNLGVKGNNQDFINAVNEYKCHALSITLLGTYINTVYNGDIRRRDKIAPLEEEEEYGGHAKRVMQSYEIWLKGKPELSILNLLGLFDRPVEDGAIAVLRKDPTIEGLTDALQNLSEEQWKYAIKRLCELRLLDKQVTNDFYTLDCHPLIRQHFAEKFKKEKQKAWKEAHSRLYEYFQNLTKEYPDTLVEMEPLFRAVAHGCLAGRHQETLVNIYWKRINRGQEAYSVRKLGAFGTNLAALYGFFYIPWDQPAVGLTDEARAIVLSCTGFCLRALGRLREAREPMEIGLQIEIQQNEWKNIAISNSNISELSLTLGEIKAAIDFALQSIKIADRNDDWEEKIINRTTLANALHQQGKLLAAEHLFHEAEKMQQKLKFEFYLLFSLQGYQFCDLLLSRDQFKQVQERSSQTLKWAKNVGTSLLEIALDNLSIGRAEILQIKKEKTGTFEKAKQYLNQAVQGLREAGVQESIVLGLLAQTEYYRLTKLFSDAWHDLDESKEIAERGEMKLHLADYHLEAARLFRAVALTTKAPKKLPVVQEFFKAASESGEIDPQVLDSNPDYAKIAIDKAKEHYTIAKKMVYEMGYGRRYPEITELEKQLKIKNPSI